MARLGHRFGSIASIVALAGTTLLAAAPPSAAATCEVTNAGTGTTYTTLQEAVDDAASGDTLEVRGTCVGRTIIRDTRLRLKGIATTEQPTPTLDGARLSRVLLVVSAKVVIRDLTITNGKARYGGGIEVILGITSPGLARLTLSGDTSVTGNTARDDGGGIYNGGTLTINDTASVSGNTAEGYGGGISYGYLTLNDSASVTGNTAGTDGGGIYKSYGDLILNDSASVTENTAGEEGGGIYNSYNSTVTLNDSASVTGNTANRGGGIYNDPDYPSRVYVCSDEVAISPNDPDDPPKVRHVCP